MHIGVLTAPLYDVDRAEAFEYLSGLGVDAVELGIGGAPGTGHLNREELLESEDARHAVRDDLEKYDLEISALATHNNPIHPDPDVAEQNDQALREAIEVASLLDVEAITTFSGLPGGNPDDTSPNWITAPWPTEHAEMLEYQWEDVTIPYWEDIGEVAADAGVNVGIEMHPNFIVYEPTGMLRLREETNDAIGANFDPSHLYWQGIDPIEAIRFLGKHDAIHHFHAKDTRVYEQNARVKGVLDTVDYTEEADRSWLFRSIGYGHGEEHWKDIVSTLRMIGYEGALSIEHEDSLTSGREGLEKAVDVLSRAVFETEPGDAYWAE